MWIKQEPIYGRDCFGCIEQPYAASAAKLRCVSAAIAAAATVCYFNFHSHGVQPLQPKQPQAGA